MSPRIGTAILATGIFQEVSKERVRQPPELEAEYTMSSLTGGQQSAPLSSTFDLVNYEVPDPALESTQSRLTLNGLSARQDCRKIFQ